LSPAKPSKKYNLIALPHFKRDLKKLDTQTQRRIRAKLRELEDSREIGKPLHGGLEGVHSLRIGEYRVLYQLEEKKLEVYLVSVAHRKHVYE